MFWIIMVADFLLSTPQKIVCISKNESFVYALFSTLQQFDMYGSMAP